MTTYEILEILHYKKDPQSAEAMKRFGIISKNVLGIRKPFLQKLAKQIGKNHNTALQLWDSGIHEARILASMIDEPKFVTEEQLDKWTNDFDSWDICDQCCINLYVNTKFCKEKIFEWAESEKEFVKRTAFSLIAVSAVHLKKEKDDVFLKYLKLIEDKSADNRNFVKKAVNWALRQIGKRNLILNEEAIKTAEKILTANSKSAKWIASDALRELKSEKIIERLKNNKNPN
ncbi:MAG: DNA alkylation repair protein [Ignavibacteria bacterium]|nr:DNA alkylation repair protein [Ignavibacteria bacterium]